MTAAVPTSVRCMRNLSELIILLVDRRTVGVLGKESPGSHVYHRLATLSMLSLFLTLMCVKLCCMLFLGEHKGSNRSLGACNLDLGEEGASVRQWSALGWLAGSWPPVNTQCTQCFEEIVHIVPDQGACNFPHGHIFFFYWNVLSSQFCVSAQLHTCLSSLCKVECQKCLGWDRLKLSVESGRESVGCLWLFYYEMYNLWCSRTKAMFRIFTTFVISVPPIHDWEMKQFVSRK